MIKNTIPYTLVRINDPQRRLNDKYVLQLIIGSNLDGETIKNLTRQINKKKHQGIIFAKNKGVFSELKDSASQNNVFKRILYYM